MRNPKLTQEIIKHIFRSFGITFEKNNHINIYNLLEPEFLLDKKLSFESEDGIKHHNNIWCASAKIEQSEMKVIVADLKEDKNYSEFALVIQMDVFPPFALRTSQNLIQIDSEEEDVGDINLNVEGKWTDTNIFLQSKLLNGVEGLSELFLHWSKPKIDKEIYELLIDYLKFLG
jgi:hypothetical protein